MATHYSKMTAICYSDSQSWCYINSNPSLSKAEDWAAVDLNAFSLIWFVPTRFWAATFSSSDLMMSWQLADKSTPHLYNLKCLFWSWEDQAIHLVLYLHIHSIYTPLLSFCIDSYPPLYHHHYFCVNVVVLLVTCKTTRSQDIEISTYLATMSSPWQFELLHPLSSYLRHHVWMKQWFSHPAVWGVPQKCKQTVTMWSNGYTLFWNDSYMLFWSPITMLHQQQPVAKQGRGSDSSRS